MIANLAVYEARHNPDHGAGPGAATGSRRSTAPPTRPPLSGRLAVVDAAANDLLWVRRSGAISTLAVFPTQPEKLTNKERSALGAPPSLHALAVQSVPTSVTLGPDGARYVGELTGWPFRPGTSASGEWFPGTRPPSMRGASRTSPIWHSTAQTFSSSNSPNMGSSTRPHRVR